MQGSQNMPPTLAPFFIGLPESALQQNEGGKQETERPGTQETGDPTLAPVTRDRGETGPQRSRSEDTQKIFQE